MSGFDSDAAAYIVGILVGVIAALAVLGGVLCYCYRKRGGLWKDDEDDEELTALRRQAAMFEEPNQAEPDAALPRPTSRGDLLRPQPSLANNESDPAVPEAPSLMTAAIAATVATRAAATSQRKQAWRF